MQKSGFIQLILILILLVIILSLLGVSLSSLFSNPVLKENFSLVGNWIIKLWNSYLWVPFEFLWNTWVRLIWRPFLETINKII
ncbi:hypothetical protein HYS99_01475 [Candidatus Giovannonibacteria bacterium]|nr:hypothetical protein [Candidatus Giovannonibacteria bacterium]